MRGSRSAIWPRIAIISTFAIALGACSDVDDALFGAPGADQQAAQPSGPNQGDNAQTAAATPPPAEAPAPAPEPRVEAAPPPPPPEEQVAQNEEPTDENSSAEPGTLPPLFGSDNEPARPGTPIDAAIVTPITRIPIHAGSNTGTNANRDIAALRGTSTTLDDKMMRSVGSLDDLRRAGANDLSKYHAARAEIMTRLQVGTTRSNPELVARWNAAQASLDDLTANLNSLGHLASQVDADSNSVRQTLSQITVTYDLPGQLDEDHRQLTVLDLETQQMWVSYRRLYKNVTWDVPSQTNFIANERASLASLAGAIKRGNLYSDNGTGGGYASMASPMTVASAAPSYDATKPLVVIKFDHPDVSYQEILLTALKHALKARPDAGFMVVGVAPTRGSASEVASAQSAAREHAQSVLRTIADMGVPETRLQISSTTDPAAHSSQVQVFLT
jgi:hypothetical protein